MTDVREYDLIIAGAGMAGILAAVRVHRSCPDMRIAVLEKETQLGGRARSYGEDGVTYGYGLNAVSENLFHFIDRTLQEDPEAGDLHDLVKGSLDTFGVLQSGKIRMLPITDWYSRKGAKALGGLAAMRAWPKLEEQLAESEDEDKSFQQSWKGTRKAPVAVVMEHFSAAFGIADMWGASSKVLRERAEHYASKLHAGSWKPAFEALTDTDAFREKVDIVRDCMIIEGDKEDDHWVLETVQATFRAKRMVVAQPPWQAMQWLARDCWPSALSAVAVKTKPTSAVVLTEQLNAEVENADQLPDVTLVPSERVQIINTRQGEICFQATIDFEMSLDAPAVLKAVRRVKRARRKLLHLYPGLVTEKDHIALQPYAWTQSTAARDFRTLEKLGKKDLQSAELCFCGDAYGASYNGDDNLISSIISTCETLSQATPGS